MSREGQDVIKVRSRVHTNKHIMKNNRLESKLMSREGQDVIKVRSRSTEKISCRSIEQIIAKQTVQDIPRRGIRHLCVDRELWNSFKVPSREVMKFYDLDIQYIHKIRDASIDDDYDTIIEKLGDLCTCGKEAATILNGVDIKLLNNINVYTQCPLLKITCIRKVVSQISLPDPMVANDFFRFYKNKYHDKFMKAAEKFFYITPKAMIESINVLKKQLEMVPFYDGNKIWMLEELKNSYKHHNKIEIQEIHDKIRQICNPEIADKFIGMLLEKSLTAMMYDVFGPRYGVGLSNVEKAKEIELQLKNRKYVTLDVSGFDNSHNRYFRQPWDYLISELADKYSHRLTSFMYPSIMKQQMCKKDSQVYYYIKYGKKQVLYAKLSLGPRLASGSTYTTLINTFLMVLAIEYVGYKLNDTQTTSSTSGDDSAAMHSENLTDEQIVEGYFSVYGCKEIDFFNNLGIKLKYCIISNKVEDLVPCSLDTFRCKCGVHMVRHFFKYIRDTFVSEKYISKMMALNIPIKYFEQLIYQGEMAWAKGLKFVEKVMAPLNHGISMDTISNYITEVYKKRLETSHKITSEYLNKVYNITHMEAGESQSEKAAKIIAILKDEKYVKFRVGQYCKECSDSYNRYLRTKYGIDPYNLIGFLEDKSTHYEYINNILVERDNRYIPEYIIREAKKFYENRQALINKKNTPEIIKRTYYKNLDLWKNRIDMIPSDVIQITPDNYDLRKRYLTELYMNIIKDKSDYFLKLFDETNKPLLMMYYSTDQPIAKIKRPVTVDQIYNGTNTYQNIRIQNVTFKLVEPEFEIDYGALPKKRRRKKEKNFNEMYKGSDTEKMTNFIEDCMKKINDFTLNTHMIINKDLPKLDISDAKEIIDYRKYYITARRFYQETGKEEYQRQSLYCYNKIKELAAIEPVFDSDLLSTD
jgi:hypothetical protein